MAKADGTTRPYQSDLRAQRAARTRTAILDAARQLFSAGGFSATTIGAIAERAGVSAPTIYATFGSKAHVARAIVEQMEESSNAAQWRDRIADEDDPRRILTAFAEWTAAFFSASMPELSIASELSAEASDLVAQGNARRRSALTALVARVARTGALRDGLSRTEATDRAWMLTGIETFINATRECGWTPSAFAAWLAETLAQQLLADPVSR